MAVNYCEYHHVSLCTYQMRKIRLQVFWRAQAVQRPLCLFWKLEKLVQWDEVVWLLSVWCINEQSYT